MTKHLYSIVFSSMLLLSGCSWCEVQVPVYIESTCPVIEVLKPIAPIEVIVDSEGNITKQSTHNLVNGAKALRGSESYYIEQINKYNKEFTAIDKN